VTSGKKSRLAVINDLLEMTRPLEEIAAQLAAFEWDYEGDGVELARHHLSESDVVGEDGVIIADGPSLELYGNLSAPSIQAKVDEWFESFDRLFIEKNTEIEAAIINLE